VTRADRITAAVLLAFSAAFAVGALKYYPYWGEGGPGSAFLPAWLAGVMALLAMMMLVRRPRTADAEVDWLPRGDGAKRLVVVLIATILYVAALKPLGMILASAIYLAFIMRYLGRHRWWLTATVAIATAAGNWALFEYWLKVPFPMGPFGF